MPGVSGGGEGPSPEKAGGVQAPSSRRGCDPTVRVSGEPGKGWGRPHDHGRGSTWASQVGSHPGQTADAGGREEPGQEPVCGLGPPRGHTVLDVDLSPELPSKPPHPPDPFSLLLLEMLPSREFRGAPRSPGQAPAVPGRWASSCRGQPHSQTPTPHTGGGDRTTRRPADTPPTRRGRPRRSGLSWQLPALSAPSPLGNPLPGHGLHQPRGSSEEKSRRPGRSLGPQPPPRAFEGRILHGLAFVLSSRQQHRRC